jgi:dolichol-phosphate mannosyltransferase
LAEERLVGGRSTHSWLKNVWWAKKGIFSFSFVPIEILGYLGMVLTALSSLALVYQIIDVFRHPELPHGTSSLIVVVALFGSLNLLAVAIVGEYLSKVLEETKGRPKFIRKAIRCGSEHLTTAAQIDDFVQKRQRDAESRRLLRAHSSHERNAGDDG